MTATAITRTRELRLDWRKAGLAATAVALNIGAIALLSLTDLGLRERSMRHTPMIVYLDDAWPTLARAPQRLADSPQLARSRTAPDADARAAPVVLPSPSATAESIPPAPDDRVQDEWRVRPSAMTGRRGPALPLDCSAPQMLAAEAQQLCRERSSRMAASARSLSGSGDAERDATFARQGARRLAAWEAQRAEPPRGDPPCETPHPVAGCEGVNIQIDLFSSRDGLLPNLRKRRE